MADRVTLVRMGDPGAPRLMRMRGHATLLIGVSLFVFTLASLLLMSDALQNSERFGDYYAVLLILNGAGLFLFLVFIGIHLRDLVIQHRQRAPGIRMTIRMVTMFCVLSVTPVLVLYYFSLDFLHRGIDNWFDLRVEEALDDSLELSKLSLELRMKESLKQTRQIAEGLAEISNAAVPFEIDELRLRGGAEELTVMNRQGSFIASSAGDTRSLVPNRPDETILFQVQQGNSYIGLDSIGNAGLSVRAVVNIPQMGIETEERIVQALFPFSERVNVLAESVERSFLKYQELSYLREQLKFSFVLLLTLVLFFSILSAVSAAFFSARRMVSPIRDLAEGTRAVADGNYATQLPVPGNDELGFLVASFNDMTRKVSSATEAARQSQHEAEAQRAYLETVLGRLSSGVLVLDAGKRLRTANISSGKILGIDVPAVLNETLKAVMFRYPYLEPLLQLIDAHIEKDRDAWREQVTLFGTSGRQILMCSGATLALRHEPGSLAHVVVFDDITVLIQGQKDAAWTEMARRVAHEIKNPLTPIQLAAERLRHKYLEALGPTEGESLDRLTNTIVHQVEAMKDMVNSFSEYARAPELSLELVDLNRLLQEVVDLYGNLDSEAGINMDLASKLPAVKADPGRIRQVFNNLINNAIDAGSATGRVVLDVSTKHVTQKGPEFVEIRIKDSGPGVSEDIISSVFEPYVTTKQKGTGLGLAIVKKIVDEHSGMVWLENNSHGPGATAVIRLPVNAAEDIGGIDTVRRTRDAV